MSLKTDRGAQSDLVGNYCSVTNILSRGVMSFHSKSGVRDKFLRSFTRFEGVIKVRNAETKDVLVET